MDAARASAAGRGGLPEMHWTTRPEVAITVLVAGLLAVVGGCTWLALRGRRVGPIVLVTAGAAAAVAGCAIGRWAAGVQRAALEGSWAAGQPASPTLAAAGDATGATAATAPTPPATSGFPPAVTPDDRALVTPAATGLIAVVVPTPTAVAVGVAHAAPAPVAVVAPPASVPPVAGGRVEQSPAEFVAAHLARGALGDEALVQACVDLIQMPDGIGQLAQLLPDNPGADSTGRIRLYQRIWDRLPNTDLINREYGDWVAPRVMDCATRDANVQIGEAAEIGAVRIRLNLLDLLHRTRNVDRPPQRSVVERAWEAQNARDETSGTLNWRLDAVWREVPAHDGREVISSREVFQTQIIWTRFERAVRCVVDRRRDFQDEVTSLRAVGNNLELMHVPHLWQRVNLYIAHRARSLKLDTDNCKLVIDRWAAGVDDHTVRQFIEGLHLRILIG